MDPSFHTMENLFLQLGLDNDEAAVNQFIENHQLAENEQLAQASFWSDSQAAFLSECLAEDSDWAEVVDHLDVQLRK